MGCIVVVQEIGSDGCQAQKMYLTARYIGNSQNAVNEKACCMSTSTS